VTVNSNDKSNPKVKLTVQAKIAVQVTHTPKELKLLLEDENASPEITITSADGRPFAIRSFRATTSAITADYDSSIKAKTHTIHPKVDAQELQKSLTGRINIMLTHPGCKKITIPFKVLAKFKTDPPSILFFNASPAEPNEKTVWVLNNYGDDFEVESVSSEKGLIEVLTQERIGKKYKFVLEITPPADAGRKMFTDVFYINIKDGKQLKVHCNGFYSKNKESPSS
jgi:hypothetical protein